MSLGSYGALCIFAKKGRLYAAVMIATLLSTGCFSSNQKKPLEDDESETQDGEIVEADAGIGVEAHDSEPGQGAAEKDASGTTDRSQDSLDSQLAPRDGAADRFAGDSE